MGKLLAIDGLNIVRRVYEANPAPDSPQKAKAAIGNALSSFNRLLSEHNPTHVLPAFECGGHTWRHDLYPRYREGRAPMPAELRDYLPQLYEALERIGLSPISIPGVEADDVLGTGVMRWLGEGRGDAIVVSTDKDLHVLIQFGARIWDYFKSEWHDSTWVTEKFGVAPEMLADLLALTGDRTDGIPGVRSVGLKKAAKLLRSYKTLEGVMGGAGILKNGIGERLRADRELAFLSRQLVQLKTDVRLGVSWKMLAYHR